MSSLDGKYYIIMKTGPFWKQARGPYTLTDALIIKEESPYDLVITKRVTVHEERRGKYGNKKT